MYMLRSINKMEVSTRFKFKYLAALVLASVAGLCFPRMAIRGQSPQAERCHGNDCLQITARRTGRRCGAQDSLDVGIQNVSIENLRGWVVFDTPSGKKYYSPTGLMHPGEKQGLGGAQYTCHSNGSVSVLANTGANPVYPAQSPAGPAAGESQLGPSEFGSGGSGQGPEKLSNHHEESSLVPLSSGKLREVTNARDGVYELPIPEYVFYTSDSHACPADMHYGKQTQRYALFVETGTARLTVKNHIYVQESDNLTSHFAGCIFPDQLRPQFHPKRTFGENDGNGVRD